MQCCKWVHMRYSQLSLSKFRTLDSFHSWRCPPPCCVFTRNTVTLSSDTYTSTVQSSPSSANAALPPNPRLQTSYPPSAHFISSPSAPSPPPLCLAVLLRLLSPPLIPSGFSNGMLEVFEPGALNYFTFFRPILLTLSVSRNPILTHLPFSGFLDSLLCILIAPTPGLAFPLMATHASGGDIIFVRQGLSFSELFIFSVSALDPYSDYVGVNISLNNSFSVSFLNVYAPLRRMAEPTPFLPPIFPPPEISSFWGNLIAITPSGIQKVLPTPVGRKYAIGSFLLTSFPSITLTHPPFHIAPLLTSPLLSPPLPFLAPGRCFRTWVLITYHFFYLSLSPRSSAPTNIPLASIFRKLVGMTLSPTLTFTVLQQRNTKAT